MAIGIEKLGVGGFGGAENWMVGCGGGARPRGLGGTAFGCGCRRCGSGAAGRGRLV